MSKIKLGVIAKDLNLSHQSIFDYLDEIGVALPNKSPNCRVGESVAEKIYSHFGQNKPVAAAPPKIIGRIPLDATRVVPDATRVASDAMRVASGATRVARDSRQRRAAGSPDRVPMPDSYTIGGITYTVDKQASAKTLAKRSGEARIIVVENGGRKFVLKLYNPGHGPDHGVLDRVQKATGGFLVAMRDHGKWTAPDGRTFNYEVMDYLPYGSPAEVCLRGSESRFREVALRMAFAIRQCHSLGMIHRDIKPENFLYTSADKKDFVLIDFGIARSFSGRKPVKVDAAKSSYYVSPEGAISSTDSTTYVGPATDYYSMGITLLALWLGTDNFYRMFPPGDLAELDRLKRNNNVIGKLRPKLDMSDRCASLLERLLEFSDNSRAGFDEVQRWYKETADLEPPAPEEVPAEVPPAPEEEQKTYKIQYYDDKTWHDVRSLRELADEAFEHGLTESTVEGLARPEFANWLAANDCEADTPLSAVAEKIVSDLGWNAARKNGWYLLYSLLPDADIRFGFPIYEINFYRGYTTAELGEYLNLELSERKTYMYRFPMRSLKNALEYGPDTFRSSQLCQYMKARKMDAYIDGICRIIDIPANARAHPSVPYNTRIAMWKVVQYLGHKPTFYFPKSGKRVSTLNELTAIPAAERRQMSSEHALPKSEWNKMHSNEYLDGFISLFFHENVNTSFSIERAYDCLEFMGRYYVGDLVAATRFACARSDADKAKADRDAARAEAARSRQIMVPAALIPLAIVLLWMLFGATPFVIWALATAAGVWGAIKLLKQPGDAEIPDAKTEGRLADECKIYSVTQGFGTTDAVFGTSHMANPCDKFKASEAAATRQKKQTDKIAYGLIGLAVAGIIICLCF